MKTTIVTISLSVAVTCLTLSAQSPSAAVRAGAGERFKQFDRNGDGKIDDEERQAVRGFMRQRGQQKGSMRQSGKTKTVGNREITEMEYASSDGRNIPCVLSIPTGEGPFPCVVTIHGGQGNRDFQYLRTMAAPNRVSPHGFYWGRDIGGSRIGRGEKTPEEKAEEEKAREIIVAFFTKQFARTDVGDVRSPAVAAVAPTKPAASESGMNPPKAAPENPPGRLAQRGAGGAGMGRNPEETFKSLASGGDKVSKEQFKQHFAKQGGPLADRPEVVERIFDRLDADKDGELDAR